MRNLIRFLVGNHFAILFILLQTISFVLLINRNDYHGLQFMKIVQNLDAKLNSRFNSLKNLFTLEQENEALIKENLLLRSKVLNYELAYLNDTNLTVNHYILDQYEFIPAKVINNSYNKRYNFITINVGKNAGIEEDMGVISPSGVIGYVKSVSEKYAVIISLLNLNTIVSSKLFNSNHFGPLSWEGINPNIAKLDGISFHVDLEENMKIVTTGFDKIFPPNISVGKIDSFKNEDGNYYQIEVDLATDFTALNNVYVIRNRHKSELEVIEEIVE